MRKNREESKAEFLLRPAPPQIPYQGERVLPIPEGTNIIEYLDSPPGVGKTTSMIHLMADHIMTDTFIYVAPRWMLLHQTADMLKREIEIRARREGRSSSLFEFWRTKFKVDMAEPNREERAEHVLEKLVRDSQVGTVIMCTHEAFVRQSPTNRDPKVTVIFDEARKVILEKSNIKFTVTQKQKDILFKMLNPYRREEVLKEGDSLYHRYSVTPEVYQNPFLFLYEFRKNCEDAKSEYTMASNKKSTVWDFAEAVMNPRLDVFVKNCAEKGYTSRSPQSIFLITSPSRMFQGYKRVIMTSAYFKESQTYHLIKRSVEMGLTNMRFKEYQHPNEVLQYQWRESKEGIENRFRKVTLIPLVKKNCKLSSTSLMNSVLLPRKLLPEVDKILKKYQLLPIEISKILSSGNFFDKYSEEVPLRNTPGLPDYRKMTNKSLGVTSSSRELTEDEKVKKQKEAAERKDIERARREDYLRAAEEIQNLSFDYFHQKGYIDCLVYLSQKVAYHLASKRKIRGNPTVVVNKAYEDTTLNRVALYKSYSYNQFEMIYQVASVKEVKFEKIPADPHGLNYYRGRNFMAYLAARNPTPEMGKLLSALIPKYNPDDDFAGEAATQAVTRLSVRDPNCNDEVFVVVPDLEVARLIAEKMSSYEKGKPVGDPLPSIDLQYSERMDLVDVLDYYSSEFKVNKGELGNRGLQDLIQRAEKEKEKWPKEALYHLESLEASREFLVLYQKQKETITSVKMANALYKAHLALDYLVRWVTENRSEYLDTYKRYAHVWRRSLKTSNEKRLKSIQEYKQRVQQGR